MNKRIIGFCLFVFVVGLLIVPAIVFGKTFITSYDIKNRTIRAIDLGSGSVSSSKIRYKGITTDKIDNNAITPSRLANNAINSSAKIASGAILTADIADGNVTSADIADGAVTSLDIANGTVASADIANGTVSSTDIANGTITADDVNAVSALGILSNVVEEKTASVDFPVISANTCNTQTVAGFTLLFANGDPVDAYPVPTASGIEDESNVIWTAWADTLTVKIRACNVGTSDTGNIAAQNWTIVVSNLLQLF